MKFKVLIVVLVCFVCVATAQTSICGKILDKETNMPLAGVLVEYNYKTQTFSDKNGFFALSLPKSVKKDDSINFYTSGFMPLQIPISKFNDKNTIIKMSILTTNLDVVCIQDYNKSKALIKEVIRRIPENYPTDTTISTFFYRNTYYIDNNLCCFEEGVDQIIASEYTNKRKRHQKNPIYEYPVIHQLLVYDTNNYSSIINNDESTDFRIGIKNHQSPFGFFDIIKTLSPSQFSSMNLSKFEENNQTYYNVGFNNILFDRDSVNLEITINKENFALERYRYECFISEKTARLFRIFIRDIRKYSSVSMKVCIDCEYKKIGNKYFLYNGLLSLSTDISYKEKNIIEKSLPNSISTKQIMNLRFLDFDSISQPNDIFQKNKFTAWEQITPYNPNWKKNLVIPSLDKNTKQLLLQYGIVY